jgi:hypothetical protein
LLIVSAFFTGLLVKFTDILSDNKTKLNNKQVMLLSSISGISYGALLALFIFTWPIIMPLALGTIFGLVFSKKFDSLGHYLGAITFFILSIYLFFYSGIQLNIDVLFFELFVLFALVSFFEEKLNDFVDSSKSKSFFIFKKFHLAMQIISLRILLELTTFLFSLFTNQWVFWITIFCFDVGYNLLAFFWNYFEKNKS